MKTKCTKCGKEFEDNYDKVNETNVRIYCNECIDKIKWEKIERAVD